MKTIGKYLTLTILVAYLMIRCDSGTETPPPAPVVVSGDIKVIPTSIKAGEPVTISWSNLVNVKTLIINTAPVSISDGSKIYTPTTTTTFSINLIGTNDKIVEKPAVVVNVTEPPVVVPTKKDTMTNIISLGSFLPSKVEKELPNGIWDEQTMNVIEERMVWTFYKDGKFTSIDPLGVGLAIQGNWNFSVDLLSLTYGGKTDSIITLDKDKIILGFWYMAYDPVTKDYTIKQSRGKRTYVRKK